MDPFQAITITDTTLVTRRGNIPVNKNTIITVRDEENGIGDVDLDIDGVIKSGTMPTADYEPIPAGKTEPAPQRLKNRKQPTTPKLTKPSVSPVKKRPEAKDPRPKQDLTSEHDTGQRSKLPLSGVALIKHFEGLILDAYRDPRTGGKPITIGWGTTQKKDGSEWVLGERITAEEADDLLMTQLEKDYLPSLQRIPIWNDLNANQQGALLSFGYNLGANFFGKKEFKSITSTLQEKRWQDVPKILELYRNPGENVEEGLLRRRKAEGELWQGNGPFKT